MDITEERSTSLYVVVITVSDCTSLSLLAIVILLLDNLIISSGPDELGASEVFLESLLFSRSFFVIFPFGPDPLILERSILPFSAIFLQQELRISRYH